MTARHRSTAVLRRRLAGLKVRHALFAVLLVALLPVAGLGLAQAVARERADEAAQAARLEEAARLVAARQSEILASASALLHALAGNPALATPACDELLAGIAHRLPLIANLSVVDRSGRIRCAALPASAWDPHEGRVDRLAWWPELVEAPGPLLRGPLLGTLSNRPVLWALRPLRTADGAFAGAVTASIDLAEIERRFVAAHGRGDAIAFILDSRGRPVIGSRPLPWNGLAAAPRSGISLVTDPRGRSWRLALAPLALPDPAAAPLWSGYALPLPDPRDATWWVARAAFFFPLAVLLFALIGIWLGAQGIILRWIDESRRLAGAYAQGDWAASLAGFAEAPREFRDLAASLGRMARATQQRDRALNAALARQRALSLELHHRVRNNLQMLASYLALAERDAPAPEAHMALAAARLRVAAIALMHRLLYDRGDLARLSAAGLVQELCLLLQRHGAGSPAFRPDPHADDALLGIDTAVPLALWLIEAVTALGGPEAEGLAVTLSAGRHGRLRVTASAKAPAGVIAPEPGPLLRAIARQLGAGPGPGPGPEDYALAIELPTDRPAAPEMNPATEQQRA